MSTNIHLLLSLESKTNVFYVILLITRSCTPVVVVYGGSVELEFDDDDGVLAILFCGTSTPLGTINQGEILMERR